MYRPTFKLALILAPLMLLSCKSGGGSSDSPKPADTTTGSSTNNGNISPNNQPAADRKGVWVVNEGRLFGSVETGVVRLDADGRITASFDAPAPRSLEACGNDVWVGSFIDNGIYRLDALANQVKANITKTTDGSAISAVTALGCTSSGLWAIAMNDTARQYALIGIQLADSKADRNILLDVPPSNLGSKDAQFFVARIGNALDRYDASTGSLLDTISLIETDASGGTTAAYIPLGLTVQGSTLWIVANGSDDKNFLVAVDLVSRKISTAIPLNDATTGSSIALGSRASLVADANSIWLPVKASGEVWRVDTGSRTVSDRIAVGKDPEGIALGLGAVWVTNSADGTVSKIDITTRKVVGTFKTGTNPTRVLVTE